MSDEKPTPVACPDCHLLDFYVERNPRSGNITITCQHCARVLLTVAQAPE